ncbi:histidine triad nucleotide-binding protein [Longirhabdus pacifica]|uniref:histidine triad nucleotide-binding protein n=1 Tax=Longirhabdus pacifica TaxID=2305227 RepID=UPI0010089401|nr:histidine triad nucleotide-binding protein [Longirhabdus pacifica]
MDCIFCAIRDGQLPSDKIYEDEDLIAFHDKFPKAPVHALIIPKQHIATMNDLTEEQSPLIGKMMLAAQKVAEKLGVKESGYRLINNCGKDGRQEVFHIHFHLLGGTKLSV